MKRYIIIFLILPVLICGAERADEYMEYLFPDEDPLIVLDEWRTTAGDSLHWRLTEYSDTAWDIVPITGLWKYQYNNGQGVRWYRKSIAFPEPIDSVAFLSMYIRAAVAAYEIYWDGTLLSTNGKPSSSQNDEEPGTSGHLIPIPREITTPGKHTIAIRISNHHTASGVIESPPIIGYFDHVEEKVITELAMSLFPAGIFLFAAIFHFALFWGQGRKWPYMIFSVFTFACTANIFINNLMGFFHIPMNYYYTLSIFNDIPWFLMITLLPIFFLFEFNHPFKKRISLFVTLVALVLIILRRLSTADILSIEYMSFFDRAVFIHAFLTIIISIVSAATSIYRKREGSISVLIGLLFFLAGVLLTNYGGVEYGSALGVTLMIVFLTLSLSQQMAYQNQRQKNIILQNTRLELELLKKHIQPHFLLNSLNSIIAWLEEDPPTAVQLITALSEELRMILNFSGENIISLQEEIDLCKAHLEVMSLRYDKKFTLDTTIDDHTIGVPPLLLHTLVENGLTHGYHGQNEGTFTLSHQCIHKTHTITLFNNSSPRRNIPSPRIEGTGSLYVRTRLAEAFPDNWEFLSHPVKNGWLVTITFTLMEK